MSEPPGPARWVGTALPLKEDVRLVAGRGRFIDDLGQPGQLHAAILRSPHAHARIMSIDTRAAAALPGVAAVLTGADVTRLSGPIRPLIPTPVPLRDWCLVKLLDDLLGDINRFGIIEYHCGVLVAFQDQRVAVALANVTDDFPYGQQQVLRLAHLVFTKFLRGILNKPVRIIDKALQLAHALAKFLFFR